MFKRTDAIDLFDKSAPKKSTIDIKITFEYSFDEIEGNWHQSNLGIVTLQSVTNLETNQEIKIESLPVLTQIELRSLCNDYFDENNLRRFTNIIPIFNYPITYGNPSATKGICADILPFKHNES